MGALVTYVPGTPRRNVDSHSGGNPNWQPGGFGDQWVIGNAATCLADPDDEDGYRINRGLSTGWDSMIAPLIGAPLAAKPEQIMALEVTLWAFQHPSNGLGKGPIWEGEQMGNTSDAIAPACGLYSKSLNDAELAKGNEDGYGPIYVWWDRVRVPEYFDTLYTKGTYGWGEGHKVHQGSFIQGANPQYYTSTPPPVDEGEERAFTMLCQPDCEVVAGFGGNPGGAYGILKAIHIKAYVGAFGGGWAVGEER